MSVRLPAGCYSDDSQLRLATCRAISSAGFDVEAFSKVELPVWLSYKLGGGKSTCAAAENLKRQGTKWYLNRFKGWHQSGGNGAAMRIQPHVWAAKEPGDAASYLPDVIRNSVCTHSHPNGLLGAVLHAMTVAHTLKTGYPPGPIELEQIVQAAADVPGMIRSDADLETFWWNEIERVAGSFSEAWATSIDQCVSAIRVSETSLSRRNGKDGYERLIRELQLRKPERRGSGVLCAVAAAALAWMGPDPEKALLIAANTIGTDTDTIATMAGAILGTVADSDPPPTVLDADLFRSEAGRLTDIASGKSVNDHSYPDLLYWQPPRTQADALTRLEDGTYCVEGLGLASELDDAIAGSGSNFLWQWMRLESRQSILIKRRRQLRLVKASPVTRYTPSVSSQSETPDEHAAAESPSTADVGPANREPAQAAPGKRIAIDKKLDITVALRFVSDRIDDNEALGKALRKVLRYGSALEVLEFVTGLATLLREDGTGAKRAITVRHNEAERGGPSQGKLFE